MFKRRIPRVTGLALLLFHFRMILPCQGLIISEIMYHPTDADEALEYIELYNDRPVFEDLSAWSFTKGIKFFFPNETFLPAKSYLIIARDPAALSTKYGITDALGPYAGRLSNNGERIELCHTSGAIVLSFRYNDTHPWPVAADGAGHSLTRVKRAGDPMEASSWAASTFINGTPGGPDRTLTPALSVASASRTYPTDTSETQLQINEIQAGPNGWIELYNPGKRSLILGNLYISNDEQNLKQHRLSSGVLSPGTYRVIDQRDIPFALPVTGGRIYIADFPSSANPARVLDALSYPATTPDNSYGRFPDGANRHTMLDQGTRGQSNADPLVHDIVINEIMYHHPTADNRYDYVELLNTGTQSVSLEHWTFTDGIDYTFRRGTVLPPGAFLVIGQDPSLLQSTYDHLVLGQNLLGPYAGSLDNHSERIRLSRPHPSEPDHWVIVDEVTYYDGGRWPAWADGDGSSLECRQPDADNDTPTAWAASDESTKSQWESFSYTIAGSDANYSHNSIELIDLMLVNRGEILLDDVEVLINDAHGGSGRRQNITANHLKNGDFESLLSSWRVLGNHVQSHATESDSHGGNRCLHLIATGHGDPGANRINQTIDEISAGEVTFKGWARWLRGCPHLLMRTTRNQSPVQPPRPSHTFALTRPVNLGSPGLANTAWEVRRGPDIIDVRHEPVLPANNEPIVVHARVAGSDNVWLSYRSEGQSSFTQIRMRDDNTSNAISGDRVFTAMIPGAPNRTMRAFFIEANHLGASTRYPTRLPDSADAPDRTCLVRVGDTELSDRFATYRVWLSDAVLYAFTHRASLSNELLDCTFVYNNTEVFYNAKIRMRGSPFLRRGIGRDPRGHYAYRIEFNPDQRFRDREEINLDNTEKHQGGRGPLRERASFWFYEKMGLPYSRQEYVRPIINGSENGIYEDVQKIDADYIRRWFPQDRDGYLHKIDDYFEYASNGNGFSNLDEGLKFDSRHPLLPETYRWGFEKRSHRENDNWEHLFDFAVAMNVDDNAPDYEAHIDAFIHPEHFLAVLAIRHAVGDWDSYGYERGKNNYFYYALPEGKWYLLPWDIDFALGGRSDYYRTSLFHVTGGEFPEIQQLINHPKYRRIYLQAYADLINGPWQTSYGTGKPPTAFDRFLDDAAAVLMSEGLGGWYRQDIKEYVRNRRNYIQQQLTELE